MEWRDCPGVLAAGTEPGSGRGGLGRGRGDMSQAVDLPVTWLLHLLVNNWAAASPPGGPPGAPPWAWMEMPR